MIVFLCMSKIGTATTSRLLNLARNLDNTAFLIPGGNEYKTIESDEEWSKKYKIYYYEKNNIFSIIRILNELKPELLIGSLPIPLTMFSALYAKAVLKSHIIIDWDDWDEVDEFPLVKKILVKISLRLLRIADKIIVVNKRLISYGKKFAEISKFEYISNGVDLELFKPIEKDMKLVKKYDLSGKKVVLFSGTIYRGAFNYMVEALHNVKNDKAAFFIIGGPDYRSLAKSAHNDKRIIFTGYINKNRLVDYLALSDITLVPLENIFTGSVRSPVKLKEYIAMEKCVLGTGIGELKDLYKGYNNLFKPDNSDITEKVEQYLNNRLLIKKIEDYNKKIKQRFNFNNLSKKLENIIKSLLK